MTYEASGEAPVGSGDLRHACWVIGGSGNIGLAVVDRFLAAGWAVLATYRTNQEPLANRDGWHGRGRLVIRRLAPGTSDEAATAAVEFVREFGVPRSVVWAAGALDVGGPRAVTGEDLGRVLMEQVAVPYSFMRTVSLTMADRGGGAVVHINSISAVVAQRDRLAYAASRSALGAVVRSLALELSPRVRVNLILAGPIESAMLDVAMGTGRARSLAERIPLRRLGSVSDCANAALFLGSDMSAYITGAAIPLEGGLLARVALASGDPAE